MWMRLAAVAVLLGSLWAAPALAADAPSRVVTAYLDHQPDDFVLLPEERELLAQAVMVLTQQGGAPGRRRMVWEALQGLENGDAGPAADALLAWQREGDLEGLDINRQVAVMVGLGNIDRVHGAFRLAMNEDSGNPNNWFLLGHALHRKGKKELAVMAFNQVQLLSDLSGDMVWGARAGVRLGAIHLEAGRQREALAQLTDAASILSDSPYTADAASARNELATIYLMKAKAQLKQASDLYADENDISNASDARHRMDAIEALYPEKFK